MDVTVGPVVSGRTFAPTRSRRLRSASREVRVRPAFSPARTAGRRRRVRRRTSRRRLDDAEHDLDRRPGSGGRRRGRACTRASRRPCSPCCSARTGRGRPSCRRRRAPRAGPPGHCRRAHARPPGRRCDRVIGPSSFGSCPGRSEALGPDPIRRQAEPDEGVRGDLDEGRRAADVGARVDPERLDAPRPASARRCGGRSPSSPAGLRARQRVDDLEAVVAPPRASSSSLAIDDLLRVARAEQEPGRHVRTGPVAVPDHRHQRHDAGAARDEQQRPAEAPPPRRNSRRSARAPRAGRRRRRRRAGTATPRRRRSARR